MTTQAWHVSWFSSVGPERYIEFCSRSGQGIADKGNFWHAVMLQATEASL
jgi:hypothetical protein